jgi:hypothetical protein
VTGEVDRARAAAAVVLPSTELLDMSPYRRSGEQAAASAVSPEAAPQPRGGRRARKRLDLISDSPAARVQRMLVLVERFRALSVLRSDPVRLVDLLRGIISIARETFGTELSRDWTARTVVQMAPDQQRCLRDLERLLQGLAYGSPDAWRGLGHAMDALLIQCLLLQTPGDGPVEADDR